MPLESFDRRQRAIEAANHRLGRHIAEIVCGKRRQQRHAHVGRRGTTRQAGLGAFLIVVGRQPPVGFRDERLVVPPCLTGHPAHQSPLTIGEWPCAWPDRPAQPVRHARCRHPQQQERQCRGQRIPVSDRDDEREDAGDDRARHHVNDESNERPPSREAASSRGGGGGRFPLQQPAARDRQTHERQSDRVCGVPSVVGEKRHAEGDLRDGDCGVRPQIPPEDRERLRPARPDQHGGHHRQELRRHHGQRQGCPHPVSARQHLSIPRRAAPAASAPRGCDAGCRGSSSGKSAGTDSV